MRIRQSATTASLPISDNWARHLSPRLIVFLGRASQQNDHAGEADKSAERAHVVAAAEVLDALEVVVPHPHVTAGRQRKGGHQVPHLGEKMVEHIRSVDVEIGLWQGKKKHTHENARARPNY